MQNRRQDFYILKNFNIWSIHIVSNSNFSQFVQKFLRLRRLKTIFKFSRPIRLKHWRVKSDEQSVSARERELHLAKPLVSQRDVNNRAWITKSQEPRVCQRDESGVPLAFPVGVSVWRAEIKIGHRAFDAFVREQIALASERGVVFGGNFPESEKAV